MFPDQYDAGFSAYPDGLSPFGFPYILPPFYIQSQKRGEALPYYLNAYQLRTIRDQSRRVCSTNEFAISAYTNLVSAIVGSGFTYRALPADDDSSDPELLKLVQKVIDVFVIANRMNEVVEPELVFRDIRDGESFIRLFYQSDGLLLVRFIEPEHIHPPIGDGDPAKSFGIETDPKDIATVRGYHVVEEPLHGWTTTFVPAKEVIHSKCNTDSGAKRGLPLFYPVFANLRRAEELLAAMSTTAKNQAKIMLIRHLEGVTKTGAQRMKTELETGTALDPSTGGATSVEEFKLGQILTSSKNISYEFPKHSGAETSVEVLRAELRAIAARLVMPEVMLTADASGGTYSSQLVAEAPATRNFERLQRRYRNLVAESRAPRHEALIWRQLAYAVDIGLLPRETLYKVKVLADAPAIIPRDPDKAAAAYKVYFDMGVMSPQQIAAELGINYQQTKLEREQAGLPPPGAAADPLNPGMPMLGAGGDVPGGDVPPEQSDDGTGDGAPQEDFQFDGADFSDL